MRKAALVLVATAMAFAAPAPAQSTYHDTCMRMAEAECAENWAAYGYPDFATCGNAMYQECMTNFGQSGGDGSPFGPTYDNVCYPSGRIDAQPC